jgi:hypothetical protein
MFNCDGIISSSGGAQAVAVWVTDVVVQPANQRD